MNNPTEGTMDGYEVLTPDDRADLVAIARAMYPHPVLSALPYQRAVAALISRARREPAALRALLDGLENLRTLSGAIRDRSALVLQTQLSTVESSPFFALVRAVIVWELYDDREVWEFIGYPGASHDLGGYIERGYNDLTWLPEPRITESDLPMTELGPLPERETIA